MLNFEVPCKWAPKKKKFLVDTSNLSFLLAMLSGTLVDGGMMQAKADMETSVVDTTKGVIVIDKLILRHCHRVAAVEDYWCCEGMLQGSPESIGMSTRGGGGE